MSEKFILTVKELHFGFIKETFRAGAVIEHDEVNRRLIIDGRKFDDVRDLDILKRQAAKYPDKPWILPFSPENLEKVQASLPVRAEAPKKPRPGENMQVVKSDADLVEPIDIKDTQISKRNQEVKEAARQKVKSDKMEIVRGDETVEERIARLKDKTDINSMAERARLKASMPAKMPVVKDDSLGAGVSKSTVPLNAGQPLPSRESVEANSEEAKATAEARKKEAAIRRQTSDAEGESEAPAVEAPAVESDSSEPSIVAKVGAVVELADGETDVGKDAEIAKLKARIAALEAENKKAPAVRRPVTRVPVKQGA